MLHTLCKYSAIVVVSLVVHSTLTMLIIKRFMQEMCTSGSTVACNCGNIESMKRLKVVIAEM